MKTHLTRMLFINSLITALLLASCNSIPSKEIVARSTNYHHKEKIGKGRNGDRWTRRLQTSTGVSLRNFPIETAVLGAVAVDPKIIPYGSIVVVPDGRKFIAVDTGSAVVSRKAAWQLARELGLGNDTPESQAPVLDFYSFNQIGELWDKFTIIPYEGQVPFIELPLSERIAYVQNLKTRELLAKN